MKERDYDGHGNVFRGIAYGCIWTAMAAGLLIAIRLVVGLLVGR